MQSCEECYEGALFENFLISFQFKAEGQQDKWWMAEKNKRTKTSLTV